MSPILSVDPHRGSNPKGNTQTHTQIHQFSMMKILQFIPNLIKRYHIFLEEQRRNTEKLTEETKRSKLDSIEQNMKRRIRSTLLLGGRRFSMSFENKIPWKAIDNVNCQLQQTTDFILSWYIIADERCKSCIDCTYCTDCKPFINVIFDINQKLNVILLNKEF